MMQSNNREFAGRNEFWTPSSIGLTQSMIDSSINNIQLNNNSSDLFKIEDSKLKTVNDLPIESKNFIITGTNEEIDSNENNAVNKRYLINKITPLDNKFMTQAQCDNRYLKNDITSLNLNDLKLTSGIDFNASENGDAINDNYPKTNLKNLITSDITAEHLQALKTDEYKDSVCPTYQYCENIYAKKSDIPSTPSSPTVDVFSRTYTSKLSSFGNPAGGDETILILDFLSENVNNTNLCSLFYTTDPNKFYIYNFDITFTIKSIIEDSTIDVNKMARYLETLFVSFNKSSSTFHFYENNMYMINFSVTNNTVEGHLTFVSMGNFRPSDDAAIYMIYDNYSYVSSTELTGEFDVTLTIKRREL